MQIKYGLLLTITNCWGWKIPIAGVWRGRSCSSIQIVCLEHCRQVAVQSAASASLCLRFVGVGMTKRRKMSPCGISLQN